MIQKAAENKYRFNMQLSATAMAYGQVCASYQAYKVLTASCSFIASGEAAYAFVTTSM
jgi:hypothetical protein